MSGIAAAAAIIGAVAGAYSAYAQSQAAESQANYQAQVSLNNATIASQNAERMRQYGDIAEDEQRERIAQTKAAAAARLAANGLLVDDPDSSAALAFTDIATVGEEGILKLKDGYAQQVYAAQVQGVNYNAAAGLSFLKASQQNPAAAAGGSLLSSAGSVYAAGKKSGAWGKKDGE